SAATLRLRDDLIFSQQGESGAATFVIKDPARGRFFRFKEPEHFIARQLDGATSLDLVRQRVEERFGGAIPAEALERFVERLRLLGLLDDGTVPAAVYERGRIRGDILYLRMKAFDPDRLLDWLVARLGFFFQPAFVAASALLVLLAFGITTTNWPEIRHQFSGLFRFESLLVAWVVVLLVVTLHEFAHGLTCKHFGGRVHEMGAMLIYFQPAFYCNVSDAWLFPEKYQRLWVTFAGAFFELFLWGLSTVVWLVTEPATTLNHLALIVVATSGIKSLFNMNPLIKLDGYYLLSDYLDIPNLRGKAFQYLGASLKRLCGETPDWLRNVTPRERRIYLIYGVFAFVYSYWLLSVILLQLGGWLVEQLQGWGFLLSVAMVGVLFRNSLKNSFKSLTAAVQQQGAKLASFGRFLRKAVLLGLLAAVMFLCRMEMKVAGTFAILPIHNADVRAEVAGIIQEVRVDEGDVVKQGDILACLSDRDTRAELRKVAAEIAEKQARLKLLKAGPRPEEIDLARTAVAKADERLKYARNQLGMDKTLFEQQLISRREYEVTEEIVAVRDKELQEAGERLKVLLAGSRPEEIEATEAEINRLLAQQRHLDEQLRLLVVTSPASGIITTHKPKEIIGQHVNKGDLIAKVHEMQTVTAEISVSEKDISEVRVGQSVVLKCRAYPGRSFNGTVVSIAPIATKSEDWRAERTVLVTTQLENDALLLKPEMSGNAKIYCGERRVFDLLTRRIARFLRVEFWSWW
ncbi:MAG: efflux RND transporter periplasmic adaptor subunit, partial [Verrucomicrobiota bacterium]